MAPALRPAAPAAGAAPIGIVVPTFNPLNDLIEPVRRLSTRLGHWVVRRDASQRVAAIAADADHAAGNQDRARALLDHGVQHRLRGMEDTAQVDVDA
jgi:hypothetical protein